MTKMEQNWNWRELGCLVKRREKHGRLLVWCCDASDCVEELLAVSDVRDSCWVEDDGADGPAHMLSNFFNTYGAVNRGKWWRRLMWRLVKVYNYWDAGHMFKACVQGFMILAETRSLYYKSVGTVSYSSGGSVVRSGTCWP